MNRPFFLPETHQHPLPTHSDPAVPRPRALGGILVASLLGALLSAGLALPAEAQDADTPMPQYNEEGRLLLPEDYREWVLVGVSLGLSYSEGNAGMEMFHETLMEPSAYRHFQETGEFRDGTMLTLLLHATADGVLPGRSGRFAQDVAGVEMAVKDSSRNEGDWAYYGFSDSSGVRESAQPFPAASCKSCHDQHAAYDNVFAQFYPMLVEQAPPQAQVRLAVQRVVDGDMGEEMAAAEGGPGDALEVEETATVALQGHDPILLVEGREELGKEEIVMVHEGFQYRFASEPNRALFEASPETYAIVNSDCPVIPGAGISPDLYAVHESRIYAFASPNCVDSFLLDPELYVSEPAAAESDATPTAG